MAFNESTDSSTIWPYEAPGWTKGKINGVPKYRIKLAQLPTPIHKWTLPGLPDTVRLSIKRDDLTGNTLSGNKVRKLEFLLADAISTGCKHVLTCGSMRSNHCRTTTVAARQVGLQPHLFIHGDVKDIEDVGCQGNLLLNRLCGAKMYFDALPDKVPLDKNLKQKTGKLAAIIKQESGEDVYQIPTGGSNRTGMFGYLQAFEELIEQGVLEDYDDIVFASGSGGTATGLALGNYLTGSRVKVHGVVVVDTSEYLVKTMNKTLDDMGVTEVRAGDIMDLIENYNGIGYGMSTQDELDFIVQVASQTGVILDPVYSGKAAYGLQQELTQSPDRFQGKRILFIHTGGVFSLFDGKMDGTLKTKGSVTNQVFLWSAVEDAIL